MPGNLRIAGRSIPLVAVLGGLGTGIAFVVVTALDVRVLISGTVWMAIGLLGYVLYRGNQNLSLTQTAKVVTPKPVVEHEVEYESVLVVVEDHAYHPEDVATAIKLAAARRRGIHVLVTLTVPANVPIDAELAEEEAEARRTIRAARALGGRRVTGHWEKVRRGEAGRRIVAEALEIRARAIVMSPPARRTGRSVFGPTLEYVLAERPCRVIIESPPGAPPGNGGVNGGPRAGSRTAPAGR
jgi:APA family basic amino acid/polyamine antiporter